MWLEWIVAWFIRIPNMDHRTKVTLLVIMQDPDWMLTVKVHNLLAQIKDLNK